MCEQMDTCELCGANLETGVCREVGCGVCEYFGSLTQEGRCMKIGCGICAACGDRLDEAGECEACASNARRAAEIAEYAAHRAAWESFSTEVMSALPQSLRWKLADSNSAYAIYTKGGLSLKLRISDHRQVSGGGFNAKTGERAGEADVQFVMGLDSPEREAVRTKLLAAIRANR